MGHFLNVVPGPFSSVSYTLEPRKQSDDQYEIDAEYQFYNMGNLNETAFTIASKGYCVAGNWGGDYHMPYQVSEYPYPFIADFSISAFTLGEKGMNILSMEDYVDPTKLDWNDFACMLEGVEPFESDFEQDHSWTIGFEDLGSTDDFDFNDVVIRMDQVTDGTWTPGANGEGEYNWRNNYFRVTLSAVGGIYPATICYDNTPIAELTGEAYDVKVQSSEAHAIFGKATSEMINTSKTGKVTEVALMNIDLLKLLGSDAENLENIDISEYAKKFSIKVERPDGTIASIALPTVNDKGKAPYGICIPSPWAWPVERTNINGAYPKFKDWTVDTRNVLWWRESVADKVISVTD